MLLQDKTAIIYGAAGAVGSAVAHAFAREGARLFLTGHHLAAVQDLADRIPAATSAAIHPAEIDALDPVAVDRHAREVVATSGRLDVSFNLLGWGGAQGSALVDISPDHFLLPIQTAMRAHFITATTAVRHMRDQGSGVILALTAQAARKPYLDVGGFGVACAALEALCRQLAAEAGAARCPGGLSPVRGLARHTGSSGGVEPARQGRRRDSRGVGNPDGRHHPAQAAAATCRGRQHSRPDGLRLRQPDYRSRHQPHLRRSGRLIIG